ncbi:cell division protein FtsZ [Tenacibaculum finnmarkense]|uniref:cell division protein FtsZ n=1 Tax=Tenacibaculum finnmarkense TaxID=2781243 RepID=UPI00187B2F1A|nr:cell division protein FtsZ [Tenacibaculum finnmarkense]MBE7648193.1 cell division protein FtsZ [Tenacibaculum finnmarkense genomovar ulcerans]MCD8400308.1 cell division protein FtsZ [Tenacibaculum finnmarkense genomovar ulcerans]MCG8750390.1 cell division protein FtsZ [Tenacibaculum finnmarkense]MCG8755313.1 cell division protein FtsZ [Tenacibaculum finnmarkense]MCG8783688.1 cell division protein FtsZ [Tenacibaculum finnmarkense]
MSTEFNNISFDMPKTQSNAIKVIGVGGGGSNAVDHMFSKQIHGVDFVICNTDAQALESSPIPNKIQLGAHLTSGLGAGANPDVGAQAAAESIQEIQQMLSTHTKMVFITAGMGGGTGTGAAPIIAKIAKDMDILTVGIVTMPFQFEGRRRSQQAQDGIDELRRNVDSLIVINNNKLREVYGNLGFKAGFSKADEVLATAAKGIAEVITHHYKQNIDLHDAKTVLSNSGTAIMGSAKEAGENRAKNAIVKALDSPLLNDNKITGAKNVLLLIISGVNEVTLDEIGEINEHIQDEAGYDANIIMGVGEDETLEDGISVTIVATGFTADQQGTITNTEVPKIVHTLEDEDATAHTIGNRKQGALGVNEPLSANEALSTDTPRRVVTVLKDDDDEQEVPRFKPNRPTDNIAAINVVYDEITPDTVSEDDFIITNIANQASEYKEVPQEPFEQDLLFDLPTNSYDEVAPKTEAPSNESKEIKNTNPTASEVNQQVEKRYVLDTFDAEPTIGKSSKPVAREEVEEALRFQVKTKQEPNTPRNESVEGDISPESTTISELQKRTKERRDNMKGYNYKFNDQVGKNIDEIERQPAYKRLGVDINTDSSISKSDTKLNTENNKLSRSNNSFLHDNVD